MRADARRNRERLLAAAVELALEIGGEPSRDAIAQRAGVGIGTLYRHFPDQQALLRAVVVDVLDRTITAGEVALAEAAGDGTALRRYLHAAIDNGVGVVNIIHPLLDDTDWPDLTERAAKMTRRLLHHAREASTVGPAFTEADITYTSIRFARPLAIGLDSDTESKLAHRQLDLYLDGAEAAATSTTHSG
ncbi:MAG: helix-turn-helix domain-containing protein [Acidimicrobiales bacterium]|nr:helix-turn-helix domain-containing protein [Acidimicrobiales bacterium]